jgi:hypothetical protein
MLVIGVFERCQCQEENTVFICLHHVNISFIFSFFVFTLTKHLKIL